MEIRVLLNKDVPAKKKYYIWEHLKEISLPEVPSTGAIIEYGKQLLIVDSINCDYGKNVTNVVCKIFVQPRLN